jgi:hypothetical protein
MPGLCAWWRGQSNRKAFTKRATIYFAASGKSVIQFAVSIVWAITVCMEV